LKVTTPNPIIATRSTLFEFVSKAKCTVNLALGAWSLKSGVFHLHAILPSTSVRQLALLAVNWQRLAQWNVTELALGPVTRGDALGRGAVDD